MNPWSKWEGRSMEKKKHYIQVDWISFWLKSLNCSTCGTEIGIPPVTFTEWRNPTVLCTKKLTSSEKRTFQSPCKLRWSARWKIPPDKIYDILPPTGYLAHYHYFTDIHYCVRSSVHCGILSELKHQKPPNLVLINLEGIAECSVHGTLEKTVMRPTTRVWAYHSENWTDFID